ncbi:hypothetical protein [Streptomyces griseofuscus]|uniref:hypothetical protein n=1 Tax=Streptomyces griseofuscus TaxID=146922 RepID=UPI000F64C74D|nr:hypothetical protein [Streptomyces griseofuscus]
MFSTSTPAAMRTPAEAEPVVQEAGCPADVASLRVVVVGHDYVRLPLALRAAQMAIAWWG